MNGVHYECNNENAEIHLHTQSDETLVVTRQFGLIKDNFDAYVTVCRFCYPGSNWNPKVKEIIDLPGKVVEIVFAAYTDDNLEK